MSLKPMRILPVPEETARVARAACPVRPQCTRTRNGAARALSFRPRAEHEAMQEVRRQQETAPWRRRYARRAGKKEPYHRPSAASGFDGAATLVWPGPGSSTSSPLPP